MLTQVRITMSSMRLIIVGTVGISLVPYISFGARSVTRWSKDRNVTSRMPDSSQLQFWSPKISTESRLPSLACLWCRCQFQK